MTVRVLGMNHKQIPLNYLSNQQVGRLARKSGLPLPLQGLPGLPLSALCGGLRSGRSRPDGPMVSCGSSWGVSFLEGTPFGGFERTPKGKQPFVNSSYLKHTHYKPAKRGGEEKQSRKNITQNSWMDNSLNASSRIGAKQHRPKRWHVEERATNDLRQFLKQTRS